MIKDTPNQNITCAVDALNKEGMVVNQNSETHAVLKDEVNFANLELNKEKGLEIYVLAMGSPISCDYLDHVLPFMNNAINIIQKECFGAVHLEVAETWHQNKCEFKDKRVGN